MSGVSVDLEVLIARLRALRLLDEGVRHGRAVARAAQTLKAKGFRPDVICVHPGWGEALYLPDVFPGVPQLHYCEFYFHAFGGAIHFDPTEKPRIDTMARTRMRNTVNLLSLESMAWGIAPMGWQHSAQALSLTQSQNVQKWCGPGGRLCYDPTTTRWTWKKRK